MALVLAMLFAGMARNELASADDVAGTPNVGDSTSLLAPPTSTEIAERVRELADPSYAVRSFATRRLAAIGPRAADALEAAARSDNVEVALRARQLLTAFERLWFSGVAVTLSLSQESAGWEESVDLLISLKNESSADARIPFDLALDARGMLSGDARQVADLLDAADFLRIVGPDDHEVALRVDDFAWDAAIAAAVQQRVDGDTVSTLRAGEKATLRLRAFNRGWARFPMLDRGVHRVLFEFSPPWDDSALAAAGVGRVVSNEVRLTIARSAPAGVSRRGLETTVTLEERDGWLVAELLNRADQTSVVNRNFGATPPFAQGRWVYDRDGTLRDIPHLPKANPALTDFEDAALVEVAPGEGTELARIQVAELRARLAQIGVDLHDGSWDVYFSYSNLCDRAWQAKQHKVAPPDPGDRDAMRKPLPKRIITGWHSSNRVRAPR